MEKYEVKIQQIRESYFCIEANSAEEAERLFANKMRNDDYFVDHVYEVLEGDTVDEEITATPVEYDGKPDFSYKYMTEKEEEN